MLMIRKERIEARKYTLEDNFIVEVITTLGKYGSKHEFWLYHKDYCVKEFMFSMYEIEEWQEPLYIETEDTCSFIEFYKAEHMED